MSEQQKHTELLKEQSKSEKSPINNNNCSEQLMYEKQYHDTGIFVRGNEEKGFFITAGQYIIKTGYATPIEAENAIKNRHYEVLMGLMDAMIMYNKENPSTYIEVAE